MSARDEMPHRRVDIVERLRHLMDGSTGVLRAYSSVLEAADLIEQQRAELVGLREQLARQAPRTHRTLVDSIAYAICANDESDEPDASTDGLSELIAEQVIADGHAVRALSVPAQSVATADERRRARIIARADAMDESPPVPAPPACSTCDGAGYVHLSPTADQAIICGDCEVQAVPAPPEVTG